MDTESLVENLITNGQKLVEEVSQSGLPVAAALWLKASEDGKWRFYIVSSVVDDEGLAQAYRRLHPLVRGMMERVGIDPLKITLIGPSNPIALDVLAALRRTPGPRATAVRWRGRMLGNVSVEGAYLYTSPAGQQ